MEWILAAHWDHLSYAEFQERAGEYQSKIVAAYRIEMIGKALLEHEAQREARLRSQPAPPRSRHR